MCQKPKYESFNVKDHRQQSRVETVYGGKKKTIKLKIQKQYENNMIKNITNHFKLKKENKQWKIKKETFSPKDVDEEPLMSSKSKKVEFMPSDNVNEVFDELFESLFHSFKIPNWFRNIKERDWFYFPFRWTVALQMSQDKY